jgi:hypothetical protein
MVTATSTNGLKRRLILNSLSVYMSDVPTDETLTFNFTFSDEGSPLTTTGSISKDGNSLEITLHKWNDRNGVYIIKPFELKTTNGKLIWLMISVKFIDSTNTRIFHLSIWGE